MRLIDRDNLIKTISHDLWNMANADFIKTGDVIEQILSDTQNEPTVEAIPIEWIEKVKKEAVKKAEESQHKGVRYWDDVREQYNFACSLWQLLAMWRKQNETSSTE